MKRNLFVVTLTELSMMLENPTPHRLRVMGQYFKYYKDLRVLVCDCKCDDRGFDSHKGNKYFHVLALVALVPRHKLKFLFFFTVFYLKS